MIIDRTSRLLGAAAAAAGVVAWVVCYRADLVLSHYDAKAHLVVARRVIDNITPGWKQIGAVWLPLPHLIEILPTQVDFFYRTGIFASLVSIACFAVTVYAASRLVVTATGSRVGAATAAALLALNPNLLYLQATPMTEPMLFAATFLAVWWLYEWAVSDRGDVPLKLIVALFAAAWTRYEAWPALASAVPLTIYAGWRRRGTFDRAWQLVLPPVLAAVLFMLISRETVGSWFVSGGFYVMDPTYHGLTLRSLVAVWWGTHRLSGYVVETVALSAAMVFLVRARSASAAALAVPVSLLATAALPCYAFYAGHPYRVRYMVPVVAGCALMSGMAVGLAGERRRQLLLAAGLVASLLLESPFWTGQAPMIQEAQLDVPASHARRAVTECLTAGYGGEKVLASMGSLAHYMQELSLAGFDLADFVHEGNGDIWNLAMQTGPAPHAGWMLVEERAEGGDLLAQTIRRDPSFLRGMSRVCEGGGVALYRRTSGWNESRPLPDRETRE